MYNWRNMAPFPQQDLKGFMKKNPRVEMVGSAGPSVEQGAPGGDQMGWCGTLVAIRGTEKSQHCPWVSLCQIC